MHKTIVAKFEKPRDKGETPFGIIITSPVKMAITEQIVQSRVVWECNSKIGFGKILRS
jgi:hypothetical protein